MDDSKVIEARNRLKIAELEALIFIAEERPTISDRFDLSLQRKMIAIGGRTFLATVLCLVFIPIMTIANQSSGSYFPQLIGTAGMVLTQLFWINRSSRITSINGPGDVGANFGTPVEALKQKPGRRAKLPTYAGANLEVGSIVEESESSIEHSR